MDPVVCKEMEPFWCEQYANPSSPYGSGRKVATALQRARERVARALDSSPEDVVFTSGGTESLNSAIWWSTQLRPERTRIALTRVEHSATLETARRLEGEGYELDWIDVDPVGRLDPVSLKQTLGHDTAVLCIMVANNETGVLFDVAMATEFAHRVGALAVCDATQALGKTPFSFRVSGADFAVASSHKLHGPKGLGCVLVAGSPRIAPVIAGGGQEGGRRGGTENVPAIVGFGCAVERAVGFMEHMQMVVESLRNRLENGLLERVPGLRINGRDAPRLPNTANLFFPCTDAEALISMLDIRGICCSAGSACMAGASEPSHVLQAMGYSPADARGVIRFSLSRDTTAAEIDCVLDAVPACIKHLRGVLP